MPRGKSVDPPGWKNLPPRHRQNKWRGDGIYWLDSGRAGNCHRRYGNAVIHGRASCNTLRQSALAAVDWINDDDNKTTVGLERKSVDRRLRRLIVETNKLERSLDRPMCVGVFGPSQAGKSYLVSVLARHGEEPLGARFDCVGGTARFHSHIQSVGDRESTGRSLCFVIRGISQPPGYPVHSRGLCRGNQMS